jgi:hypothetical protein
MRHLKTFEDIKVPIEIGDTVLGGRFKNKKTIVKKIGKNKKGDITINDKPLLKFRLVKESLQEDVDYYFKHLEDDNFIIQTENDYLIYNGYKYIYDGPMGAANEEGMAKAMADAVKADGVMFVHIDFSFEKGFGIGGTSTLKVKAFTRISVYDKKGEKLFVINENERSKKTMMMVGGIPVLDVDKILPNCESAMEELMGDLNKRIQKIIKKTDNKL